MYTKEMLIKKADIALRQTAYHFHFHFIFNVF